jgi:hypothetical protein
MVLVTLTGTINQTVSYLSFTKKVEKSKITLAQLQDMLPKGNLLTYTRKVTVYRANFTRLSTIL